ncbi:MAG: hypothetical protein FWH37_08740 [Candidatus Bathyarchaeota archaeon]|nr:hypothetical protein [Candidatus Termiticorpusculum sp.]
MSSKNESVVAYIVNTPLCCSWVDADPNSDGTQLNNLLNVFEEETLKPLVINACMPEVNEKLASNPVIAELNRMANAGSLIAVKICSYERKNKPTVYEWVKYYIKQKFKKNVTIIDHCNKAESNIKKQYNNQDITQIFNGPVGVVGDVKGSVYIEKSRKCYRDSG